jgi:uncharacterized protein YkwD
MLKIARLSTGKSLALSLLAAVGLTFTANLLLQSFSTTTWARPKLQRQTDRSQGLGNLRKTALNLANRDRRKLGLSALTADPLLHKVAQLYAEDMLRRNYFSHYNPEGKTVVDRYAALGGQGTPGENLAILQHPPTAFVPPNASLLAFFEQGWMGSPTHRPNLVNPKATRFGFGIAGNSDRIYAVQMFGI